MTPKQFIRRKYPTALAAQSASKNLKRWGKQWIIWNGDNHAFSIGHGRSPRQAWANAAEREKLERKIRRIAVQRQALFTVGAPT